MEKDYMGRPLTKLQKDVIKSEGTEPPFHNDYWDQEEEGIYVDRISGEVLFSSKDKFSSGCGWPSFTKPIDGVELLETVDLKLMYPRVELKSKLAKSHLGHVFNDGPVDRGGLRYCINSASIIFIPKDEMKTSGYEKYLDLFE